jgi:flavin-dependent dehydrogenase
VSGESASRHARLPARSTMIRATCDVLVIGGGPAGIAAASQAAELGARTLLVDEGSHRRALARESAPASASARRRVDRLARSGAAIRARRASSTSSRWTIAFVSLPTRRATSSR